MLTQPQTIKAKSLIKSVIKAETSNHEQEDDATLAEYEQYNLKHNWHSIPAFDSSHLISSIEYLTWPGLDTDRWQAQYSNFDLFHISMDNLTTGINGRVTWKLSFLSSFLFLFLKHLFNRRAFADTAAVRPREEGNKKQTNGTFPWKRVVGSYCSSSSSSSPPTILQTSGLVHQIPHSGSVQLNKHTCALTIKKNKGKKKI